MKRENVERKIRLSGRKKVFEVEEGRRERRGKERKKRERFVKIELKRSEERTTVLFSSRESIIIKFCSLFLSFYENCSSLFALFSPFSSRSSSFYFHFFLFTFLSVFFFPSLPSLCSCHLLELLVLVL